MIEVLDTMPAQRKILIHINNTNPILDDQSQAASALKAARIDIAYDGMQLTL